ncbi:MAG: glutamine-hydrolyzing carbamoyl-phosphate synthase small subunit [Phycisphaerales bacterium]
MASNHPPARLALEDGTVLTGRAFGAFADPVTSTGEVVFNTAMSGYQEALTDPSYAGQILTMTAPMIGNYGVCSEDDESSRPQVAGFVVRELARLHWNYRAAGDLSSWLSEAGVLAVAGIDTRALVRRLRIEGAMRGVLSNDASHRDADLIDLARSSPLMAGRNLVAAVSPDRVGRWTTGLGQWGVRSEVANDGERTLRVLALDCGAKQNIYRHLVELGCEVMSAPHNHSAQQIRELEPDGLFISNGPGDPAAVSATIATLREVAGDIPTFGTCLGHQMLALALGARTYKLKFGHRGANQPVRSLLTGRVEITSQNHGFCVDRDSLAGIDCEVTHVHLNDDTVAGFRHRAKPIFAVQFHPEASPGPHDASGLFYCFVLMMRSGRPLDAQMMAQACGPRPLAAIE